MAYATLARLLPGSVIRYIGRLQFKYPILAPLINRTARAAIATGRIQRGVGKGLLFDARDSFPGYLLGTTEPEEQQVLAQKLQPGMVFYDVGANIGYYCVMAARLIGTKGKVYAFEPSAAAAARTEENARLNSFENIQVVQTAVGSSCGQTNFSIVEEVSAINAVTTKQSVSHYVTVPQITIDSFADSHEPPSLIMIDIEGAEIDALLGALETIQRYRPTLMVEVHWLGRAFEDFVEEHLLPLGYVATTYEGEKLPAETVRYHCLLTPSAELAGAQS